MPASDQDGVVGGVADDVVDAQLLQVIHTVFAAVDDDNFEQIGAQTVDDVLSRRVRSRR